MSNQESNYSNIAVEKLAKLANVELHSPDENIEGKPKLYKIRNFLFKIYLGKFGEPPRKCLR